MSSIGSDDPELKKLREEKELLVQEARKLQRKLKRNEKKSTTREIRLEDLITDSFNEPHITNFIKPQNKDTAKLCEISQSILGVKFNNVEKNWISGNVYCYKTTVESKAIRFELDLTVDVEANGFTFKDINCHFIGLDKCYLEEISPWIQLFTREKNFSNLISAISDYSDQSIIRAKILRALESKNYISMEKCQNEGGGIYVYVHPAGEENRVFFKFHWSTKFVERTWKIEHIFVIDPIEADEEFVKANEDFLQGFCKIGLQKSDLEDLWTRLCNAIDDVSKHLRAK